nr:MAG TPA: hypothetical protein [Caudoviricetes sp.]
MGMCRNTLTMLLVYIFLVTALDFSISAILQIISVILSRMIIRTIKI